MHMYNIRAAEQEWHDELSDPYHYGTDVETVAVHRLELTHHVEEEDADNEPLHINITRATHQP